MPDRGQLPDQGERDPCDGCDGMCGDVCPVYEARRLSAERRTSECSHRTIAEWSALEAESERLRAENEKLKARLTALAADPCGCRQTCGDDDDIDGPGTCKGLPPTREPLVEFVVKPRRETNEEGRSDG